MLLDALTNKIMSLPREKIYFITRKMQLFRRWCASSATELFDYTGTDQDLFYDVYVEHPKLVKLIKDIIKGTYGHDWYCSTSESLREFVNKINLFEDDSDFLLRFTTDGHHYASRWYEIDLKQCWNRYSFINEEEHLGFLGAIFVSSISLTSLSGQFIPVDKIWISTKSEPEPKEIFPTLPLKKSSHMDRSSYCYHECIIGHNSLTPIDLGEYVPEIKNLSFDGEMDNDHGKRFSDAKKDPILQLSLVCTRHNSKDMFTYLFALGLYSPYLDLN